MKLDCVKNILIYQKALYAEQLYYYSKLCELYSKLATLHPSASTADEIVNIYSKPLSLASSGNLNFSEIDNYSSQELYIFKKYAFFSEKFNEFKKASELLSEVLSNG